MKKPSILLSLILTLALAVSACKPEEPTEAPTQGTVPTSDFTSSNETAATTALTDVEDTLVLGQPIEFDGFTMNITALEVVETTDGEPVLKVVFDWLNTSAESDTPHLSYLIASHQNGKSLVSAAISSADIDRETQFTEVRPGGLVRGVEEALAIDDISQPLRIELSKLFDYGPNYSYIIEDLSNIEVFEVTDITGGTTVPGGSLGNSFELLEPVEFSDFIVTVNGLKLLKDADGNSYLKVVYDWENRTDSTQYPNLSFRMRAFQEGVETPSGEIDYDKVDVDRAIGQQGVEPGETLVGAEAALAVVDESAPLEFELYQLFTDTTYSLFIENLGDYR